MNIMGGLTALDEYFKEGDRRKVREYQQALRDAELSTLGDKIEADRADYVDRRGAAQARTTLRPGETDIARTTQGTRLTEAQGAARRAPTVEQTRDAQAATGLSAATSAQQRQPLVNDRDYFTAATGLEDARSAFMTQPARQELANNKLTFDLQMGRANLEMLPRQLVDLKIKGAIDEQGQSDVVTGTLGNLIASQDKEGALRFANSVARESNLLPGTNGQTIVDIQGFSAKEGYPNGGYALVDSNGKRYELPVERIQQARQKLQAGKYDFRIGRNGEIISGNVNTGQVNVIREGTPGAGGTSNRPAEIQAAEWLVTNKIAKNPEEAWKMVRASKEKTRSAFIQDYILKNAGIGDPTKQMQDAGKIWDQLNGVGAPRPGPGSNTPGAPTLDPRISNLIGVPSSPGNP